jgi:hypothetical protein
MLSIAIVPPTANRIRALKAANPDLDEKELAAQVGVERTQVKVALTRKQKRRKKSVAP